MLQIHINVCDTVQLLVGFLQCNGIKLEEAEDFKCVFVVYCVLEKCILANYFTKASINFCYFHTS